jgi:hypothetical protein
VIGGIVTHLGKEGTRRKLGYNDDGIGKEVDKGWNMKEYLHG